MEHHDRFGILGTPLLSDARSAGKLSLQNKIAPTPVAYSRLRHTAALRKDRRLLDDSVQLAPKDDGLYIQRTRAAHVEDVMDDEDRVYLRLRALLSKRMPHIEKQTPSCYGKPLSFLQATVDFPEISSKRARTPLGYRELHNIYSLRPAETSQIHSKTRSHSDYNGFSAFSLSARKNLTSGLGYGDKGATDGTGGSVESNYASDTVALRKSLESAKRVTGIGYESDEEDYIYQLANSGYKDLDATEKLMSRKLEEGRTTLTMKKGGSKRTLSDIDGTQFENVLFTAFVQWQAVGKQVTEWTEYAIPASFAAYPSHDCEKDHMKTNMNVLPPLLQQEYKTLLDLHKESMSKESDNVKTSIAKATEEHEARLRRIRGLVLEDMGTRFVAPQAAQTAKIPTSLQSRIETHTQYKGHSAGHPKEGESNRTIQHWKPENLLCKRLGVEEPKDRVTSISKEYRPPLNKSPGSSHSADDFQIHSITNNKRTKLQASGGGSLLQSGIALTLVDFDEEERVKDNEIRPSRDLIQTIFVNPRVEEGGKLTRDESDSKEISIGTVLRTESESRGIHKTRAVDFF